MRRLNFLLTAVLTYSAAVSAVGQITERQRPVEWANLVRGGRFMDRFEAMPDGNLRADVWGADSVRPRFVDNGIERPDLSFWGGNIVRGDDGRYHLFVCGWPERSEKGHMTWPASTVYHTTSSRPWGPYTIADTIGKGHNPEVYRTDDGRYVLYVIDGRYVAPRLSGPWTYGKFDFDTRDRRVIEGLSNLTFARRSDGSFLMVCRGGGVWVSRDGVAPYRQITERRIYPAVAGEFEDPVVWRDSLQYHLIVNDWLGRIAYYQRSLDGVHWLTEPGEAYAPGVSFHRDGRVEHWFKYERAKVLQDAQGRVEQINFAVIDTIKWNDLGGDRHSSKNICLPMNKGLLLEVLNRKPITDKTRTVRLRIRAEKDFHPITDVDVASVRFGCYTEVNYGRGARALSAEADGEDLILTFDAAACAITPEEFFDKIKAGDILIKIPRAIGKAGDITGGLPRVTELFEARNPSNPAIVSEIDGEISFGKIKRGNREIIVTAKDGEVRKYLVPLSRQILVQENDYVKAGMALSDGAITPSDILRILGPTKVQEYIVNEVQDVYRMQGVKINDKHFEVIVRQMMNKVQIEDPGDTRFFENQVVDKWEFMEVNDDLYDKVVVTDAGDSTEVQPGQIITVRKLRDMNSVLKRKDMKLVEVRDIIPATSSQILQGITRAALQTSSFIAAASFQETTKVLNEAAIMGKTDPLENLKENVICGHMIPAGTGMREYNNLVVGSKEEYEQMQAAK